MQQGATEIEQRAESLERPSWGTEWRFWVVLTLGITSFVGLNWDVSQRVPWLTFVLLTTFAVASDWFFAAEPNERIPYLSAPLMLTGVMLLPAPPLALLVVTVHLTSWLRTRWGWKVLAFDTSARLVSVVGAYLIHSYTATLPAGPDSGAFSLLGALGVAAALTLVYRFLVATARPSDRGLLPHSRLFALNNLVTQFVVLLLGLPIAIFWQSSPWLTIAALAPLLLTHRALIVPALEQEARTDIKTGLHNVKSFNEALDRELQRAIRFGHPVSLLVVDLDLLRHVNNSYGHQAGDIVLRGIADTLRTHIREYDVAARFGGDEFTVLLVECDSDSALHIAERIRKLIASLSFELPTSLAAVSATVSIGVASFPRHGTTADQLMYQADLAVYRAKLSGRNRVCLAPPPNGMASVEAPAPLKLVVAEDVWSERQATDTIPPAAESNAQDDPPAAPSPAATTNLRSRGHGNRPPQLLMLMSVVATIAVALLLLALPGLDSLDWLGLLSLVLLTLAAEAWAMDLYEGSTVSLAVIPVMTAAMLFGVPGGALIGLTEGIARGLLRHSPAHRIVFNSAVFVLGASVAGTIFHAFGWPLTPEALPYLIGPAFAVSLVFYAINTSLVALAMGLSSNQSPALIWHERFRWLLVHYVVLGLLGLFLGIAYRTFGIYGLLAFVGPAFAMRYAMHQYISNTSEHVAQLRQLNAEMQRSNHEMSRINEDLLNTLAAAIDVRDPFVYGHSTKVAEYAVAGAHELHLGGEMIELIRQAALLHDIGKLGISEAILHKPAKLDADEYEQIKTHSTLGAELLSKMRRLQHLIPAIKHHHEYYNGKGYPSGLAGTEIPIEARILAVCDAIEAMASDRPYHRALPVDKIVAELQRCAGTQFDPDVVEAFVRVITANGGAIVSNSAQAVREREARPPAPNGAQKREEAHQVLGSGAHNNGTRAAVTPTGGSGR